MGIRLLDAKRRQRILEICLKGFEDYANLKENKRAVYSQAYGIRENHLLHSTFNKWKQAIPLFIQQRQHSQLKLKYFNLWIKAFILKQVHLYSFTFHFLQYFFLVLFIPFLIIIQKQFDNKCLFYRKLLLKKFAFKLWNKKANFQILSRIGRKYYISRIFNKWRELLYYQRIQNSKLVNLIYQFQPQRKNLQVQVLNSLHMKD